MRDSGRSAAEERDGSEDAGRRKAIGVARTKGEAPGEEKDEEVERALP